MLKKTLSRFRFQDAVPLTSVTVDDEGSPELVFTLKKVMVPVGVPVPVFGVTVEVSVTMAVGL